MLIWLDQLQKSLFQTWLTLHSLGLTLPRGIGIQNQLVSLAYVTFLLKLHFSIGNLRMFFWDAEHFWVVARVIALFADHLATIEEILTHVAEAQEEQSNYELVSCGASETIDLLFWLLNPKLKRSA